MVALRGESGRLGGGEEAGKVESTIDVANDVRNSTPCASGKDQSICPHFAESPTALSCFTIAWVKSWFWSGVPCSTFVVMIVVRLRGAGCSCRLNDQGANIAPAASLHPRHTKQLGTATVCAGVAQGHRPTAWTTVNWLWLFRSTE